MLKQLRHNNTFKRFFTKYFKIFRKHIKPIKPKWRQSIENVR